MLICVRHGQSELNAMHAGKKRDPEYKKFIKLFRENPNNELLIPLALNLKEKYVHKTPDWASRITALGRYQALGTGVELAKIVKETPAAVFVSSYLRAKESFGAMKAGWPALENVENIFYEDYLREQDIGVAALYGDFEVFWTLNPEQRKLRELEGDYFYKFPSGENLADLRSRIRPLLEKIQKPYNDKPVLVVAHAQTLLAIRAEIENWDVEEYMKWRINSDLINCAVSIYKKLFDKKGYGKLKNTMYNRKLYK
ncbi:MAG: histidine phosphatase family protein [Candidatus Spechtbacterales bacterium]